MLSPATWQLGTSCESKTLRRLGLPVRLTDRETEESKSIGLRGLNGNESGFNSMLRRRVVEDLPWSSNRRQDCLGNTLACIRRRADTIDTNEIALELSGIIEQLPIAIASMPCTRPMCSIRAKGLTSRNAKQPTQQRSSSLSGSRSCISASACMVFANPAGPRPQLTSPHGHRDSTPDNVT